MAAEKDIKDVEMSWGRKQDAEFKEEQETICLESSVQEGLDRK